jgi:hypothetical protein
MSIRNCRARVVRGLWVALLAFTFAQPAFADSEVLALFDLDNNPATGCAVTTADGQFDGAESVIITTIATGAPSTVTGVSRQVCSGGVLVADPSFVPSSPLSWPVGMDNGPGAADVVETYAAPGLVTPGQQVRIGFLSRIVGGAAGDADAVILSGGQAIIFAVPEAAAIPALGTLGAFVLSLAMAGAFFVYRRRLAARGMTFVVLLVVAGWVLAVVQISRDGEVGDWVSINPSWTDGTGDGPPNADILAIYMQYVAGRFDFRFDMDIQPDQAPTVTGTTPADAASGVASDGNLTITFSEPVNVTGNWFRIDCSSSGTRQVADTAVSGGPDSFTVNPNADFAGGETCTVTVDHALVSDQDGIDPPDTLAADHVFAFTVEHSPVALDDSASVTEDAAATTVDVLANDTDIDGGPKVIHAVTQPAHGTVVITNAGADLTYQPAADYCNNPPGSTLDTFTYTLAPGGATATVTVTVTCVDDSPAAAPDTATVSEDALATAIDVLANDSDAESDPFTISSVTQPANGTVVITGGGTGLTYQPNANYCNTPPGSALDTFTYTLTPGGAVGTVTVTVNCVDDSPVAVADAATVNEDSGATTINVQANDTDIDGGTNTISSVTQPANGTVVITNGGTDLTYAPTANYCNNPPGGAPSTFTYTLSPGGATATVSVTVNCVDDFPVAVADAATIAEDAGATAISVLANDADVDGGAISINSVTQPANGTVVITGGGSGLTYAPAADYCNNPPGTTPDTFTYTLAPGASSATVSVTVTCVNDGPVIDLDADDDQGTSGADFAVTFTEGDPATLIEDPLDATLADVDSESLVTLTITITNLLDVGNEILAADVTDTSIVPSYVPASGMLTLVGPDTVANFEKVLRTVQYLNSSNAPDATARVIHFVANDGSSDGNTAVATVSVSAVDTAPTAVADAATVNEDSGATAVDVLANDTDPDGGPISVTSVAQPANGTVVITGGGTGLTYAPNANYCNNPPGTTLDSFTYTLSPGGSTATVTVTVTCTDDNPTAVADSATVIEDASATAVNVLANDTDPDDGAKTINSVTQPANGTVVITGGGTGLTYAPNANYCGADSFTYSLTPGGSTATVSMTVTCVDDNPTAVADSATVTEDSGANAIDVLANDTDPDGGAKAVTSVTQPTNGTVVITGGGSGASYTPNANYCGGDSFTYTLTPGGSSATATITVTCVDDPAVAVADSATVNEDSGANTINVQANDTDVDGGTNVVNSVTQGTNGTVVITNGGADLTYAPAANYCGSDSFSYTLSPGGSSATVSVTVTCVNDPPVAGTDTFETFGNTELRVDQAAASTPHVLLDLTGASGVLNNDSDPVEGSAVSVTGIVGCGVVTAPFSCATANGGQVVMAADGSFSYLPPASATFTSDSFQYILTDADVAPASVNGTVNITLQDTIWYVDPNAGGGDGRSAYPYNDLAALNGVGGAGDVDNANDYILVYAGSLSGSIELEAGQRLIGEGVGLSLNLGSQGAKQLLAAGVAPELSNASGDAVKVTAALPARIAGLSLQGSSNAIDITSSGTYSGATTLTIEGNTIRGAGAEGIDFTGNATGTVALAINDNVWSAGTHSGKAIDVVNNSGTLNLSLSNNAVISSGSDGINVTGASGNYVNLTGFGDNSVDATTAGSGITVTYATFDATPGGGYNQVSGGTTLVGASGNAVGTAGIVLNNVKGNLAFTDLDIYAGTGAGLSVSAPAAGDFTLAAGAGSVVEATAGPAVDVTNTAITLPLSRLVSANSTTYGVNLNTVTGSFSAPSGSTISTANPAATAFRVTGSNATIGYAGTINTTAGKGVDLTSNTGSTISLTGTLSVSSGASAAFTATGGGTVTATDTTNTLTTTTGTPLNVQNTTIGGGGLKFRSIAANGAANGIYLLNTGSSGGLTVSGTGTDNTGGIIQNTTGDAILLSGTRDVSLSHMRLASAAGSWIDAATVTNLTLTNVDGDTSNDHGFRGSSVTNLAISGGTFNRGGAGAEPTCNVNGFDITNLLGTSSITGATFTRSNTIQFRVNNTTTSGSQDTLTVSGTTWGTHTGPCAGDHLSVNSDTGGNFKLVTSGTSGENNFTTGGIGVQASAGGSGAMQAVMSGLDTSGNTAGVAVVATATSGIGFNVLNNSTGSGGGFSGTGSVALVETCTTSGTCQGAFSNNSVTHTAGIMTNAMQVVVEGNGTGRTTVSNNTVSGNFQRGLHAQSRAGTGTLDMQVTGNSLTETDVNGLQVMNLEVGASGGGTTNGLCLNLQNNTATPAGANSAYRLLHRTGYTYELQNLAQANTTNTADVQAWVSTTKTNAGTPVSVTIGTSPFTSAPTCDTATLPTP